MRMKGIFFDLALLFIGGVLTFVYFAWGTMAILADVRVPITGWHLSATAVVLLVFVVRLAVKINQKIKSVQTA